MAVRRRSDDEEPLVRRKPSRTPKGREDQLVAAAIDLAEKQLADGTASAQVITHYLKLGSSRERLEQERIQNENRLTQAKIESMAAASRLEELMTNALDAFRSYSGQPSRARDDDDDDYRENYY